MFVGKMFRSVDEKGRLVLPSNFRREFELADDRKVIIAPSEDKCLIVLRPVDFRAMAEAKRVDMDTMSGRDKFRFFVSNAGEVELDKAGRIVLGEDFRRFAGIETGTEATVAGMLTHVEIWNKERFLRRDAGADARFVFAEAMEEVTPG